VTGRHGGAISKPAQDLTRPATTALTCMRPCREQPHQRAVADAGAAVQLAFGVARRRRCISGGHTTVECQPTMQADPHTARGRRVRSGTQCERLARGPSRAWFGRAAGTLSGGRGRPQSLDEASVSRSSVDTLGARPQRASAALATTRSRPGEREARARGQRIATVAAGLPVAMPARRGSPERCQAIVPGRYRSALATASAIP
jgi:hypothetical protein